MLLAMLTVQMLQADVVADYIQDFASAQEKAGRILYNTTVDRVSKTGSLFHLFVHSAAARTITCSFVVMANGLWQPNSDLDNVLHGSSLLMGYDELPSWGPTPEQQMEWENHFSGKDVMVLGMGNAGHIAQITGPF